MALEFADTAANFLEFPAKYYYNLKSSNGLELTVLRADTPPKITDGRGGWEVVDRRRRKGLTEWVGRNPLRMEVPVLFNGWYDPPYSIDKDISVLSLMALGDEFVEPPTVKIIGNLPAQGVVWVIENLQWGDDQIWLQDPNTGMDIRVRQDCVVQLLQFVDLDVVKVKPQNGPQPSGYTTKKGDTPKSIAQAKGTTWQKVRDANPSVVRSPNQPLTPGTPIQIPS